MTVYIFEHVHAELPMEVGGHSMTPPRPRLGGRQNGAAAAAELGSLTDRGRPHFGRCLPERRGRGVAGGRGAQIPDRWILAFRGSVS